MKTTALIEFANWIGTDRDQTIEITKSESAIVFRRVKLSTPGKKKR